MLGWSRREYVNLIKRVRTVADVHSSKGEMRHAHLKYSGIPSFKIYLNFSTYSPFKLLIIYVVYFDRIKVWIYISKISVSISIQSWGIMQYCNRETKNLQFCEKKHWNVWFWKIFVVLWPGVIFRSTNRSV